MSGASKQTIDRFLAAHRIAAIGVSRDASHFSRKLAADLRSRGYEIVPVNPHASEMDGVRCFASVVDVDPKPEAALVFTTGSATDQVVRDCDRAGVPLVWMYRAVGAGAVSTAAVDFCRERGIEVVPGECPYMFLPGTQMIHRMHGFVRKLRGSYPA